MIDLNIGIYTRVKIQPVEFYTCIKFVKMSYLWLPGQGSNLDLRLMQTVLYL